MYFQLLSYKRLLILRFTCLEGCTVSSSILRRSVVGANPLLPNPALEDCRGVPLIKPGDVFDLGSAE